MDTAVKSRFVTRREMMGLLDVSAPTLHRWCRDGIIPAPVKRGTHRVCWDRAFAEAIAEALATGKPMPQREAP